MKIEPNAKLYFIGIGGTGMASVAGLAQQAGFEVEGSDNPLYPPMSTMLESLKIKVSSPYSEDNLKGKNPDLFIVGNALSRGHPELELALASGTPYTSFPGFMGQAILNKRENIVVAGTHGKTTTTSLMTHSLMALGVDPGYLIGGIPKGFSSGFSLGKHPLFVIEGDEYDTAFFDKNSKFLHYRPRYIIFNNLEFDHADIFADLSAIERQFSQLLDLVPDSKNIIANWDDPGVRAVIQKSKYADHVTKVSTAGKFPECDVVVKDVMAGEDYWECSLQVKSWGIIPVKTSLIGQHNIANIAQVVACINQLQKGGLLPQVTIEALSKAIASFAGVSRRLELIASESGVDIYEDFAHHPTSVGRVIDSFRLSHPAKRLVVAFEPRNATSRRNVFMQDYAKSLGQADQVMLGYCPVDSRIPEDQRMNTQQLADMIGPKAKAFDDNGSLLDQLAASLIENDVVIFMSSGSFSGIQYQISDRLKRG